MYISILETPVCNMVREISRKMDSIFFHTCEAHGLTVMKLKCLMEIRKVEECTIGGLGEALGVAGGNISNMCKALESDGLLARSRSTQDERVVNVRLTEKGERMIETITRELDARSKEASQDISEKEYENMIEHLDALNHFLDHILRQTL